MSAETSSNSKASDFSNGPIPFSLINTDLRAYREFKNKVDDQAIALKFKDKNFYQLNFKNEGGLISPIVLEFTFTDGSRQLEHIPAEIWRYNEEEVTKVFAFDKEVRSIQVDPKEETADINVYNNVFPRQTRRSQFDRFKGN